MNIARHFIFVSLLLSSIGFAEEFKLPFKAKDLAGHDVVVESGTGGAVLVFLSARCPCSNSHIDLIKNLAAKYPEFKFYAVHANHDESLAETQKYFSGKSVSFPVIDDASAQTLANELHANKTPHVFLLSKEGEILYRGGATDSHNALEAKHQYLADALESVHKGEKVSVKEARTLGCVIAR